MGYGTAVLLFTIVFSVAPPEMAWRYLFFLGLLPAFFVLWIRRYVEEPQVFREMQATRPTITGSGFSRFSGWPAASHVLASMLAAGGWRQLCDADMARNVSQNGAQSVGAGDRRVSRFQHLWFVSRLRHQRAPE